MRFVACSCQLDRRRFSPSFCCLQGWFSKELGCYKSACFCIAMRLGSEGVGELRMWMLSSVMLRRMVLELWP